MIGLARVGIVGLGAVGRIHLEAYRTLTDVEVVAVTETDPSKVRYVRETLRLPAFGCLEDMLKSSELDIVCVLTPPAAHEEAVIRCATAGVHVLCEKPMALSVAACERMIEACRTAGVRLCYGASYRYLPAVSTARDMIRRGDLGQVLLLREYAVGGNGPGGRGTLSFTHYPKGGPGGAGMGLCDHGVHLIDAFSWLIDSRVRRACGRGNISGEPQGPEFAHLEYENGAVGELLYEDGTFSTDLPHEGTFAWGAGWSVGQHNESGDGGVWQPHPGCIHVHGTLGALRIFHYANTLFFRNGIGIRQIRVPDEPAPANFSRQLRAFIDAIRVGSATPVPGEAGLDACRTLLGIYSSQSLDSHRRMPHQ